jgi:hypothetical protein
MAFNAACSLSSWTPQFKQKILSTAGQPSMPRDIVIVYKAGWRPWRVVAITRIASGAWRSDAAAAGAGVRAAPGLIGVPFADPTGVLAGQTYHANRSAPAWVKLT